MKALTKCLIAGVAIAGATALAVDVFAEAVIDGAAKSNSRLSNRFSRRANPQHKNEKKEAARAAARAWLAELPQSRVMTHSFDGLRLMGHWIPTEEAKRTVILVHGWHGHWDSDLVPLARYLHNCGCNLLYIEQRGHDGSEGDYIGLGVSERFDVLAWAQYAALRTPMLPLYLFGNSMGAATVMMASDLPMPETVSGIIADCGFSAPEDIMSGVIKNLYHLPPKEILRLVNGKLRRRTGFSYADATAVDSLSCTDLPVLFIHGMDDKFVPYQMSEQCYAACSGEKEIFLVPDAGHSASYLTDPDGYEARLAAFFKKHDDTVKDETNA